MLLQQAFMALPFQVFPQSLHVDVMLFAVLVEGNFLTGWPQRWPGSGGR
jgi:hypothetical protein